jgi:hypothetical protein
MASLNNTRVAWSVAIASLALWTTSVPTTWGQISAGATQLLNQTDQQPGTNDSNAFQAVPCPPGLLLPQAVIDAFSASAAATAPATPELNPGSTVPSADANTQERTFHLCGPDAGTEREMEHLIAGRGFSASITSTGDGCADVTIRTTSPAGSGRASTNLNVSLGSGHNLSIQIVSEGGATHVSIGQG